MQHIATWSAPYGAMLCFLISIAIILIAKTSNKIIRYVSLLAVLLAVPALILLESRAAWLATAVVFLCVVGLKPKIVFILTVVLCGLLYTIRPDSVKGRLFIWKVSLEMIQDAPITGFGVNGFEANYMNYQCEYFKQNKGSETEKWLAGNVVSAYNEPIRITVEYGVVGLIVYLLLVYLIFFRAQTPTIVSLAAQMVLLAYFVFGLFSYPNRILALQVVAVIALACLLHAQKKVKTSYIIIAALLLFGIGIHLRTYRQRPLSLLNYCVRERGKVDEDVLLDKLNQAIQLSPSSTAYRMKGDCLYQEKQYKDAEQAYWTACYMVPFNQQARAKIVFLYMEQGRKAEAKQLAASILKAKVKSHGIETYILRQKMKEIAQ